MPSTATLTSTLTGDLTASLGNVGDSVSAALPAAIALLAVLAVGYAACYAVACWLAPFARCGRCRKRDPHSPGKSRRECRRCNSTGRRLRLGRRLWNWIHHEYRDYAGTKSASGLETGTRADGTARGRTDSGARDINYDPADGAR